MEPAESMAQDAQDEEPTGGMLKSSPADGAATPDVTLLYPAGAAQAETPSPSTDAPIASPGGAGSGRIAIGSMLNHIYEVRRFIARGGMGEVYEGVNVNTDERVAIKVVLSHMAEDANVRAMFRKEARVLTRLSHPALVQYRVLANEPVLGVLYIVTDYLDGVGLDQFIGKLKLSPADVLSLMKRLAEGLKVAHDLGAIHRDISPDNILLPGERIESATIIDFGIAKDLESSHATIVGHGFAGKLAFVAPEQFGDFDRAIGPWTDIYSLGLVMLAVAAGKNADMGSTLVEAIDRRRAGPDLSILDLALQPLFSRMLAANPKDRFPSMAELLEAIAKTDLNGPPPESVREERAGKPPKPPKPQTSSRQVRSARAELFANDLELVEPPPPSPPQPSPPPESEKPPGPPEPVPEPEPAKPPEAEPVMGASAPSTEPAPEDGVSRFDLQARSRKREGAGPMLPLVASVAVLALAAGGWFFLREPAASPTEREAARAVDPATPMTMTRGQAMARISVRIPGVTLDDWVGAGKDASGYGCDRLRRETEQWNVCGPDEKTLGKIAYEVLGTRPRTDAPEAARVAEILLWIVAPQAGPEEKAAIGKALRAPRKAGRRVSVDQGDARIHLLTDRRGALAFATILPIEAASVPAR